MEYYWSTPLKPRYLDALDKSAFVGLGSFASTRATRVTTHTTRILQNRHHSEQDGYITYISIYVFLFSLGGCAMSGQRRQPEV